jgi:hypothetical protein
MTHCDKGFDRSPRLHKLELSRVLPIPHNTLGSDVQVDEIDIPIQSLGHSSIPKQTSNDSGVLSLGKPSFINEWMFGRLIMNHGFRFPLYFLPWLVTLQKLMQLMKLVSR